LRHMGIFLALLAAFFAFSWRITVRTKLKPSKSDIASTALIDFFGALTALLFIPFFGIKIPSGTELLGLFLLSVFLSAISDYLLLFATKNADTADSSILMPLSNIWVLLLAAFFLGESITLWKVVGVILIAVGSIVTLSKGKKFIVNKGIIAAFIYGWLITGTILIDKGISNNFSLPVYSAVFYFLSSAVLTLLSGRNSFKKINTEWKINGWWNAAVGAQWALFSLALLFAYTREEASKAVPIMRVFIVLVTIYSIFVMKEKERMWQKILGSIIVTGGALVLAYLG
jgi:drug/metabolite transporter (DMT)-like permease